METSISKPHAVLISNPGLGHLIPVLELGKRLVTLHNFEVTIFVVASQTSAAESEMIQAAMSSKLCQVIKISPPNISHLVGPDTTLVTILAIMMRESKSALRVAISTLKSRPTAMIFDLFRIESFEIADELEIPNYYFVASHAWFLALTVYTPILDKFMQGQYVDQIELETAVRASLWAPQLIIGVAQRTSGKIDFDSWKKKMMALLSHNKVGIALEKDASKWPEEKLRKQEEINEEA
ncbi:anthocyanidin 3-O-glucosyltransferase 5-like [Pistacia vera]|uniref:anthocyanidin 3-O-glucosyltransferase 5-like n=1 Tax=Pistacia vera TaxID=55513 RepID=UPI001263C63C|nr:anthocyanidin 3-O-glucosyltransferase 5-like [Pistacia vera]